MVVFDKENNNKGKTLGTLYMFYNEVKYFYDAYVIDGIIPDYLTPIKEHIEKIATRPKYDMTEVIAVDIKDKEDFKLIEFIQSEILKGNIYTKDQLSEGTLPLFKDLLKTVDENTIIGRYQKVEYENGKLICELIASYQKHNDYLLFDRVAKINLSSYHLPNGFDNRMIYNSYNFQIPEDILVKKRTL